jgi:iron complex transport system permease protein
MPNTLLAQTLRLGFALGLASCALLALGLMVGSMGLQPWAALWQDAVSSQIVWDIRAPRTMAAWLAGALLGLSGAIAQGVFRNPLADPYLLGSSSGASVGVVVLLALMGSSTAWAGWAQQLGLTTAAFVGAVMAVMLTMVLAQGVQHTLRLLLAGVIVAVVLGAVSSLIAFMHPHTLQTMQAFALGSTAHVGWAANGLMGLVLLVALALAVVGSRVLDGLALGEDTAKSLGLPVARMRMGLVLLLALATGVAVAHTGLIAFVGLAAPHLVRSIVRPAYRWLLPLSALMGGVLLLASDLMARWWLAPQELPVGVLTAILGGTYLLALMYRSGVISPTRGSAA